MSDGIAIVDTRDVTKQFGSLTALRSVSLQIREGECLTIFGRNGAGKSTFLKIVSSLIRWYKGTVRLFGIDLRDADESLRAKIGLVSHESLVYGDLTVLENLIFFARLYRLDHPRERAQAVIHEMGLDTKTHSVVRALSRGMRQRLSLGRAFLHAPRLLLLDEPFTGLDEQAGGLLDERIAAHRAGGGTTVMATHDAERGWRHADRIAVFDRGRVAYETSRTESTLEQFRLQYRRILAN